MTITGGNVTGSTSIGNGGALWVGGAAKLTLTQMFMSKNAAMSFGGVIHVNSFAVVAVNECMLVDNSAQQGGGAVHVHYGVAPPSGPQAQVTITNSYGAFNRCNGAGGFLELVQPPLGGGPLVSLVGTTVEANLAVNGGGVLTLGADTRIEDIAVPPAQTCDGHDNSAAYANGVPVPTPTTGVYLEACVIRGNIAAGGSGGGLLAAGIGTTMVVRSTRVVDHHSSGTGAGIYLQSHSEGVLQDVHCADNVALLGACVGLVTGTCARVLTALSLQVLYMLTLLMSPCLPAVATNRGPPDNLRRLHDVQHWAARRSDSRQRSKHCPGVRHSASQQQRSYPRWCGCGVSELIGGPVRRGARG